MALKKPEIAKFKKQLEDLRAQITHSLNGTTREVKTLDESTGYSQHQADQGTDDFDRTISLEVTSKEFDILRHIERALEKIEENTYGVCDITGEPIPIPRLEAVPYATMTVKAQEKLEKRASVVRYRALIIGSVVFLVDFISKYLTSQYIPKLSTVFFWYPYGGIGIFRDFYGVEFSIVHAVNKGAAWSAFADHHQYLFAARIILIVALFIYVLFFNKSSARTIPLALILAGALGNVVDTFLYGHVIDMFRFVLWGYDYPVFNVADSAICVGVVWMMGIALLERGGKKAKVKTKAKANK